MTEEGDADGVKGHAPPLRPLPPKAASTAVRTCYRGVVRDVVPKFKSALAKAGESEDRAAELAERLLKLWLQKLKDEHGVDLGAVSAVDKKKGSVVWKNSAYRVSQEVDGIAGPMLGRPSLTMSRPSIETMVSTAPGRSRSESRRSSGASSPTSSITSSTDDGTKARRSRGSSASDGAERRRGEGGTRKTGEQHRGPPSRKRRRGRSSGNEDGDVEVEHDVDERGAASAPQEARDGPSAAASEPSTAATLQELPEMPPPPTVGPTFPLAPLPPAPPPDIATAPVTSSQLHALMLADDTDDEDEGAAGHDSMSVTLGVVLPPPHLPPAPTVTFAPGVLGALAPVHFNVLPIHAEHVHADGSLLLSTPTVGELAASLQIAHGSVLGQPNLVVEPPPRARPDLAALMLEDDDDDEEEAEGVGGDGQDTRALIDGRDVEGRGPLMTGGVDGGGDRVFSAATASASADADAAIIGLPLPEPSAPPTPTDTNDDLASTSAASETMDELQLLLGSGLMGGAGSDACSEDVAFSNPVLSRALSEGLGLRNVKPGGIMTALNSTDAVFLPWDAFFGEGSTDDETPLQLGGRADTYAIGSTQADLDLDEESMLMPSEEQVGCKLFGRLKKLVRNNREKTWTVELQDCFYVTASEERLFKRVHCKLKADI